MGRVTDPVISNPNPQGLTFPYPLSQDEVRPDGDGCLDCVHQTYCPAVYWFYRYTQDDLAVEQGRQCAEFSRDPSEQVRTWTQNDLDEVDYQFNQGIGSEARRNGITNPVTGSAGYF